MERLELFELAVADCKFSVDLTDGGVEDVESVLIGQVSNDADALLVYSADRGFEFPTLPSGGGAVVTGCAFGDVTGGEFGEGVGVGEYGDDLFPDALLEGFGSDRTGEVGASEFPPRVVGAGAGV